jgi:hypothetical protein
MVISIDTEKDFDEFQHPFRIKVLKKPGIERIYLKILKGDI